MMVLAPADKRQQHHDLWLGGSTALVAGLVNVCCVIAFFAFGSNITGHVAIFAEEMVKGHWHQMSVVVVWMSMFLFGAFTANVFGTFVASRNAYVGHGAPLLLEMAVISYVAYYGHHHYAETLKETEYLVASLLFAMGLQNGMVATVSNGVVKTTHLTGLFTDLGMELSMMLQARYRKNAAVRFKLQLHLIILGAYVIGGAIGALTFLRYGFLAIYQASGLLGLILAHDLSTLWFSSGQRALRRKRRGRAEIAQERAERAGPPLPPASMGDQQGWKQHGAQVPEER